MSKKFTYGSLSEAQALLTKSKIVVTAMAAAEPQLFYENLTALAESRSVDAPLRVFGANPNRNWDCFQRPDHRGRIEFVVMFLTAAVRKATVPGLIQYMPQHLSQWASHLKSIPGGVDLFWGTCSKPDSRGFVSLGVGNCYESEILRAARHVVLEVNEHMPVTFGSTEVHIGEVDLFLERSAPLPVIVPSAFGDREAKIAAFVADLIEDDSTLQLGIGGIPNAVAVALRSKRNLGIHTEMINDAMMHLFEAGVITGRAKTLWPRKIVGAFALGSKELYDFVSANPMVEFHPASVVNDPYRIGRNHKMVSLNTAVEVDFTGQVCSESVGHLELSGVGGASETHIGAQRSRGGRGIIAVPSTAKGGAISKIVSTLQPGAKVSISRNDVDTVVSEFGVAVLKGRTVAERIRSLVSIAHPEHRDKLMFDAKSFGYL